VCFHDYDIYRGYGYGDYEIYDRYGYGDYEIYDSYGYGGSDRQHRCYDGLSWSMKKKPPLPPFFHRHGFTFMAMRSFFVSRGL
jgi:hypothetical protein